MENTIPVKHITYLINKNYDAFTSKLESILGKLDFEILGRIEEDPKEVETMIIDKMEGAEALILFQVFDHGTLLHLAGKSKNAKQYLIGNPRIASLMTRYDIRAALYAPLRVLVFEYDDKNTQVEYDLPSSLFGQFNDDQITEVALSLDNKMDNLLKEITDTI